MTIALAVVIVAAVAVSFAPALRAGFVFDDHALVQGSALLRGPLWKLWFSAEAYDYWPLTWTTFWAGWRLWGEQAWDFHAVNLVLHAAAAVLLWRTLRALGMPGAWLAGLLFAVHPVTVESVAWISELKNTLSAVFFLATLRAWIAFEDGGKERSRILALICYLLALLAKTSVVMLPFLLLGIAWHRRGRIARRDLLRTAPFFGLAIILGAVTVWFQWNHTISDGLAPQRGLAERLGGAGWALASYLQKALVPVRLGFVYPDWPLRPDSILFYAPSLLAGAALLALWWFRNSLRSPLLALGYHALMVLPVLGLVEMAYFHVGPVSNHLQYLAIMGPVALVAATMARLATGRGRVMVAGIAVLTIAWLAQTTYRRTRAFESDASLWAAAAREAPGSLFAVWMHSDLLGVDGRREEALAALDRTARESSDEAVRHGARSLWLLHSGRYQEAVAEAQASDRLRRDPEFQEELGSLLTRANRPVEAIPVLEALVRRSPRNLEFRYWLGAALVRGGRLEEAADVLRESCRLVPADLRGQEALAMVLIRLGLLDEARLHLATALGLPADSAEVAAEVRRRLRTTGRAPGPG